MPRQEGQLEKGKAVHLRCTAVKGLNGCHWGITIRRESFRSVPIDLVDLENLVLSGFLDRMDENRSRSHDVVSPKRFHCLELSGRDVPNEWTTVFRKNVHFYLPLSEHHD